MMVSHSSDSSGLYRLCIIGAGALGSRHLQAMAGLLVQWPSLQIDVIDPSAEALQTAQQRWAEVVAAEFQQQAKFYTALPKDTAGYDLAVIATSAKPRLQVIRVLLNAAPVKALILEKVLFTTLADYQQAENLFQYHQPAVWVNCTRRTFQSYKMLKAMLPAAVPLQVRVSGGDWGLACNAIHFIDLLSYLAEDPELVSVDCSGLAPETVPSKRPGYIEFHGQLKIGFSQGSELELLSAEKPYRHLIEIRAGEHRFLIDEVKKQLLYSLPQENGWQSVGFELPPTSSSMTVLYQSIVQQQQCGLPDFAQSSHHHKLLIRALSQHLGAEFARDAFCPIT